MVVIIMSHFDTKGKIGDKRHEELWRYRMTWS